MLPSLQWRRLNRFPFFSTFDRQSQMRFALLMLLIAAGAFLRLKNLGFQSLWIDELNTMMEADPATPLSKLFSILKQGIDPHPPLYHLITRVWFMIAGFNEYTARLLSAFAGILTIPAMYYLGKELFNSRAGMIAAAFTTFNYYNIYYSQEARGYIFAFLFTCLSFAFLSRVLRNPAWRTAGLYVLSTVLLLYTHYYGLIILACQAAIGFVFLLFSQERKRLLFCLAGAWLAMIVLYAPWIPATLSLSSRVKSFWIPAPKSHFFINFFKQYFGGDSLTITVVVFLMIVFLLAPVFNRTNNTWHDKDSFSNRYLFSFMILTTWIVLSYVIPYVRSLISVPLLFHRYTIVTLPAILLSAAIGLELLLFAYVRTFFVLLIAVFSIIHLFPSIRYYDTPAKTQWRETISFVAKENRMNAPIITKHHWHQQYYYRTLNVSPRFVKPGAIPHLTEVWLIEGHVTEPLNKEESDVLNRDFRLVKSFTGVEASAKLFSRRRLSVKLLNVNLTKTGFYPVHLNDTLLTEPLQLTAGKYWLYIYGYGDRVAGRYPRLQLRMNELPFGDFQIGEHEENVFSFQLDRQTTVQWSFSLPADSESIHSKAFIRYLNIDPEKENMERLYRLNRLKKKLDFIPPAP